MFLALHFEYFIWGNYIPIKWGRGKHWYSYANASQDFFSSFFFKKTFLKTYIIPYSHFALCICKHCWEAARPGYWLLLSPHEEEVVLLLATDSCFFFQSSDSSFSSPLRLTSISGEGRTSQGGRSISLFPSIEEWGRMMMKNFSVTSELSTNFFSFTLHSHPTFLLMHCELTDQVSHLSVRLSFL